MFVCLKNGSFCMCCFFLFLFPFWRYVIDRRIVLAEEVKSCGVVLN